MEIRIFDASLEKFIKSLQKPTIAKVLRTIDLLEQFGEKLGPPHTKKISDCLFEIRILGKQEVRIFYTFHKLQISLLHGFVKKSQRIPQREIKTVLQKLQKLKLLDKV
jgi:phage-related protein